MATPAKHAGAAANSVLADGDAPNGTRDRSRPQDLRQNLIFRRLAERVWRLGPRRCAEAMLAVADGRDLMSVLESFAEIDPELLDPFQGRTWSPAPMRVVP
jgi:hypothetical protein